MLECTRILVYACRPPVAARMCKEVGFGFFEQHDFKVSVAPSAIRPTHAIRAKCFVDTMSSQIDRRVFEAKAAKRGVPPDRTLRTSTTRLACMHLVHT